MFSMENQTLRKGRNLTIINSQKKRIVPDVILHTKNVMIPVIKPLSTKRSYDIPFSENRPQILKAPNCRNNPALLFSEAASHILYNHLENLFEVRRVKRKTKNQNMKHTVSGKTDSLNIKKINVLQNSCPLERLSLRENNNIQILHFPNTIPTQSLVNDKVLRKTSSKSIELSRKYNLSQMKEGQMEDEDKFVVMPKVEMPISDISKSQIVSLPNESFYDIANTVSTVSTLSASSYNIQNKETSVNIRNRKESKSKVASNHPHPSNSECEINVLHYESDILPENRFLYFAPFYSKSLTNWSSTEIFDIAQNKDNNWHSGNKETIGENHQNSNVNASVRDMKFSWRAASDCVSPFQKRVYENPCGIKNFETFDAKPHECEIKYSWQVIGTSTQTSHSLLQDLLNDNNIENHKSAYKTLDIKYSWQIIGISTQASLHNCNDPNYWNGILLTPNKNYNENNSQAVNNKTDCAKSQNYTKCLEERLKRCLILNNQQTQTFAEKNVQVYMERILEALTNQDLSGKSGTEQINNQDKLFHEHMIKPLMPNISNKNSLISNHENTKKEELLQKLTYTIKKLNQCEQSLDKNCNIDITCFDAEDTSSQERTALPKNVEENIIGIMQSAQEYVTKLNYQLNDLDCADQQIENNMMRTLKDIDETFQSLLDDVCREINERREQLILETEIHKYESLIPLKACRKEVEAQIQNAQGIISMSEIMLQHPYQYKVNSLEKIIATSNNIGRIPAVPYSEELPNISFDRPLNSYKEDIIEQISRLGCISRTVPVQIISIEERPAGLFVKWHITNPEYIVEEQTFIVEKANGEIFDPASDEFETVYKGSETSCFIRNMIVNQPVTLRVRIETDNIAKSVHHVARTSISPYSWELDNKDYMVTNNGKIAAKLTDTVSTLFSSGPQFDANHIIEFKFLEVSQEGNDDEGIALVYDPQDSHDTLKRVASLMITPRGKIFMDGDEKLMCLPRMRFNTNITISATRKNAHVLRLNIESENKCVTYDWRVQTPLYFAARFTEYKKWNLMVK